MNEIEEKLLKLGVDPSWQMEDYIHHALPILQKLAGYKEKGLEYCPQSNLKAVFKPFSLPLNDVSVVIVGQDPYPDIKVATGLAFDADDTIPYSLEIIQETYCQEVHGTGRSVDNPFPHLKNWANDGVLLLNSHLTCDVGKPNSHAGYWSPFIREVIKKISDSRTDVVFCLWGASASRLISLISEDNYVFNTNHPASVAHGYEFKPRFKELVKMFPGLDLPF